MRYPMVKRLRICLLFSHFNRTPVCDRQTDGQTDILPQHSPRNAYTSHSRIVILYNKIFLYSVLVP